MSSLFDKARGKQKRAAKAAASTSRPEPEPQPAGELHDPYYRYQPSGEQYHPLDNGAGPEGYHPNNPNYNLDAYRRQTYTVNPPPNYDYPYGWEPHNGGRGFPGYSFNDATNNTSNNSSSNQHIPPPPEYSSYQPGPGPGPATGEDPNGECFIM